MTSRGPAEMAEQRHPDGNPPGPREPRPVSRSANQARQGEIILGPRGRWIWIGAFVLVLALLLFGI